MDTKKDNPNADADCPPAYVQMYYNHQYERMSRLEGHSLTVSNIVITLSVVGFTFGFGKVSDLTPLNGLGLPLVMIIANLFAMAYARRCVAFISMHDNRAKETLHRYAPALWNLDAEFPWPKRPWVGGRMRIQWLLHLLLIVAALFEPLPKNWTGGIGAF